MEVTATIDGLRWDSTRNRLKVLRPDLADAVLRDRHIVAGIEREGATSPTRYPGEDEVPSISGFFQLWYTVNSNYTRFNTELRKVFTVRTTAEFADMFTELAAAQAAKMPAEGDLVTEFLSPYLMHSTFAMIGVPESDWPNLSKVSKLVIHLFKQQLLGETEHSPEIVRAHETVMRYLKSLTDRLLRGDRSSPFLDAARALAEDSAGTWPIAALIGQLLMAGIEPMIVGASITCREIWSDKQLLANARSDIFDIGEIAEEAMRVQPPFGNIFRFVVERCECLGMVLEPGTVVAIDISAVHLAQQPAAQPVRGCPVRPNAVLTFGKGMHYCLGANSARLQISTGLRELLTRRPELCVDPAAARIDTFNNLKEVRALPYTSQP
ncbi:cytochrome P450 [Nocardia arthritidis]|uniref:Cytochrome P450 n=1 Tax=Nocardia arthritidis TaxID=228602 RepID=A0A6G9YQX1_9NOCA|nr:cytochrome P450 [Nocardia arthritidis]QIS15571.1 hypothetical protein F5544_38750 [Nocardia arthritidis]